MFKRRKWPTPHVSQVPGREHLILRAPLFAFHLLSHKLATLTTSPFPSVSRVSRSRLTALLGLPPSRGARHSNPL